MLDRARKVFIAADGSTKASSDLRRGSEDPRKSGAAYAIYSALNMNVAESILYGCQAVIVEGPSDQHYLSTIKTLLIGSGKISPKREIVFPPSHGANNAKVVASILSGKTEELPFVLLDDDDAGRRMARDLQNGFYQSAKDRVMSVAKYVGYANAEIEDLIPTDLVAECVDKLQRNADVEFVDVVKPGVPIVPQIEAWARSQGIALCDGWKVDLARALKLRALTKGAQYFGPEVIQKWVALFQELVAKP